MILTFNGFTIKIIIINDDFKYKIKIMIEIIVIIDDEFRRKCVYIRFFFFQKILFYWPTMRKGLFVRNRNDVLRKDSTSNTMGIATLEKHSFPYLWEIVDHMRSCEHTRWAFPFLGLSKSWKLPQWKQDYLEIK